MFPTTPNPNKFDFCDLDKQNEFGISRYLTFPDSSSSESGSPFSRVTMDTAESSPSDKLDLCLPGLLPPFNSTGFLDPRLIEKTVHKDDLLDHVFIGEENMIGISCKEESFGEDIFGSDINCKSDRFSDQTVMFDMDLDCGEDNHDGNQDAYTFDDMAVSDAEDQRDFNEERNTKHSPMHARRKKALRKSMGHRRTKLLIPYLPIGGPTHSGNVWINSVPKRKKLFVRIKFVRQQARLEVERCMQRMQKTLPEPFSAEFYGLRKERFVPLEVLKRKYAEEPDQENKPSMPALYGSCRIVPLSTDDTDGFNDSRNDRYYSRLNIYELSKILGYEDYHIQLTKEIELGVLEMFKSYCCFNLGYQTWIRDTTKKRRAALLEQLHSYTSVFYPELDIFKLEVIIRRGSYGLMQSRLRRERRITGS